MEKIRRVVLYGNSLFIAGVEAGLNGRSGLSVTRLEADLQGIEACLATLDPDVVIVDLTAPDTGYLISLVTQYPGIVLIGLELSRNSVVVLSSHQHLGLNMEELVDVVQANGLAPAISTP